MKTNIITSFFVVVSAFLILATPAGAEIPILDMPPKELAEVAKISNGDGIGVIAIVKLTDQTLLADVACNGNAENIRKAAVEKLTDQAPLAVVAKNSKDKSICIAAIKKLTDQAVLEDIVKNPRSLEIQAHAIVRLDQVPLADTANNDRDELVRNFAAQNPFIGGVPKRLYVLDDDKVGTPKRMTMSEFDKLHTVKNKNLPSNKIPTAKQTAGNGATRAQLMAESPGSPTGSNSSAPGAGSRALTALTVAERDQLNAYFATLGDRIKQAHKKPEGLSMELVTRVEYYVGADGIIGAVKIIKSSGNRAFDDSVLKAFRSVHPIGPRPDGRGGALIFDFRIHEEER